MKSNLFLSPVAVGVLGVAIALSVVVGIVVNYTSRESTVIDTTAANRLANLQQAAGQSGSNVGVAFAAELPEFELKATPEPLPATAEPDALIWWDSQPTATTEAIPTATPIPPPTATPWPTPLPTVAPRYQTLRSGVNIVHVSVPGGWLPCYHLGRQLDGNIIIGTHSPYADWFNSLPESERQEVGRACDE